MTFSQAVGVSSAVAQHEPAAAFDASDTILAWGDNNGGELGDGTTTDRLTPVAVDLPADTTVTAVAAGHDHSLAVTSAGTALAWGDNRFGQLGDGTTTDSTTPVEVSLPMGVTITAIAAGDDHSYAVTSAGTALAWSDNDRGELGDGTTTRSSTPIPVDLPVNTTVTAVAGGIGHGLALTSGGTVLAWGLNSDGQLGDGTTTDSSAPVEVSLPASTAVTAVAAGSLHNLAVTAGGTALAWGNNSDGRLGDGTSTNSSAPVEVSLPAGTAVTAGAAHSMALVAPPPAPPTLPTTGGASLPITLTATILLILTGAALIHLAYLQRPTHRPG
nr:chromosome condensation regulator RCC1 [Salinispora arenicola]